MSRSWASVASGRGGRQPERGRGIGPTPARAAAAAGSSARAGRSRAGSMNATGSQRGASLPRGGVGNPAGSTRASYSRSTDARNRSGLTRGGGGRAASTISSSARPANTWAESRRLPTNDKDRRVISVAPTTSDLGSRIGTQDPRLRDSLVEYYVSTFYPLSPSSLDRIFAKVKAKGLPVSS